MQIFIDLIQLRDWVVNARTWPPQATIIHGLPSRSETAEITRKTICPSCRKSSLMILEFRLSERLATIEFRCRHCGLISDTFLEAPLHGSRYCPYCNKDDCQVMSDEHIIPKSIGGGDETVIRVCKSCNDVMGGSIDTLLSRHSMLRSVGMRRGLPMKRQERHPSQAKLKDGRELSGRVYFEPTEPNKMRICFDPDSRQTDGSKWISSKSCKDITKLPADVHVLTDEMLVGSTVSLSSSTPEGMEPAMIKILLGVLYLVHGQRLVANSAFDSIRDCLSGTMHPRIIYNWLESPRGAAPAKFVNGHTLIWSGCDASNVLHAGVSLYSAYVTLDIRVPGFGIVFPSFQFAIETGVVRED